MCNPKSIFLPSVFNNGLPPGGDKNEIEKKIVFTAVFLFLYGVNTFAAGDKTYDKLKLIIDIMELINAKYISETDPEDLVVGTIKGILA